MRVAICPHDSTKNRVKWIYFLTYLSSKVGVDLAMEQCFDFTCYYEVIDHMDLVYANPLDALMLFKEKHFIPVAGNDNYDEVVLICSEGQEPKLEAVIKVGAVENQFATFLGLKILMDRGVKPEVVYMDSWQKVLSAVAKGEIPYGILYKDFWDQVSDLSKRGVEEIFVSDERLFSHVVMVSPEMKQYRDPILWALKDMPSDPEGKKILEDLRISTWYEVKSLDPLEKLVEEVKHGYKEAL